MNKDEISEIFELLVKYTPYSERMFPETIPFITRKQAVKENRSYYRTRSKCKHGHKNPVRLVSCYNCFFCHSLYTKAISNVRNQPKRQNLKEITPKHKIKWNVKKRYYSFNSEGIWFASSYDD